MKKVMLLLTCMVITISAFAQDIIVTKDAKKIEAKITEVSKSEIKYKEWDNQEGPTFILEVADINTIIYSNGKVAVVYQVQAAEDSQKTAKEETEQTVNVDYTIERTSKPLTYRFNNLTSGASDFRWDFGDGTWSFAKDAIYSYEEAGTYTVLLTATVGNRKYEQRKTITVGENTQRDEWDEVDEALDQLMEQSAQNGEKLGKAIQGVIDSKNSYVLDVTNNTKHPYRINLDGHILGVVNPYKTERFIVSVEIYGRLQAVQTSGYVFSPSIKEFKVPRQQKQTACSIVIK